MALTYTEIEQQKNTRIWIFFVVVLLFYFLIALILANATKMFFVSQYARGKTNLFLSGKATLQVLLFAFVAAVVHSFYSATHAISLIQNSLKTQILDLSDRYHKRFQTIVDEVNVATGSKYHITPVVIPVMAMNAFAISDYNRKAIVGVTEGLLAKLNRQQLQAVVAHEAAHVASGDSFQTTIACSLFGIYAAMLSGIKDTFRGGRLRASGRGSGGIILFLGFIYIILYLMQFFYNLVGFALSRNRELRADAIAVRLTRDPISLSEALYAISRGWRGLGFIEPSLEALFIINPVNSDIDEAESIWADFMATHPPINKRVQILAQMAHADVNNIQEKVVAQEKLRQNLREFPTENKKARWMFKNEEQEWQGPFNISQIMALGWLRPDTWIKPMDSTGLKQAKDEPLLKPMFEQKMGGHKSSQWDCPKCAQGLVEEKYEGTTIYRCLFCEGALLEKAKVSRIIVRKEKGFDQRIAKLARLAQQNGLQKLRQKVRAKQQGFLNCPKCGTGMVRGPYTMVYLVEIDRCFHCGLVWFDKDELEMVQYLIENKEVAKI